MLDREPTLDEERIKREQNPQSSYESALTIRQKEAFMKRYKSVEIPTLPPIFPAETPIVGQPWPY
jgi:hypothetical protein